MQRLDFYDDSCARVFNAQQSKCSTMYRSSLNRQVILYKLNALLHVFTILPFQSDTWSLMTFAAASTVKFLPIASTKSPSGSIR